MTRVPMGSNLGDVGWGAVNEKIGERWPIVPQGISAEVIAEEWNLSREQLDEYSLESHRRAVAAIDEGKFEHEIVPIEVGAGGALVLFAVDETPRRDTSLEKLASLQPAFKPDGVVTAGNSSSIVDGSAAMLLASGDAVERLGLEPRARFVSFGLSGVDPYRMLHGNPEACARALSKAGLTWDDISVIEVNEAFASVVLQFLADTGLHERWEAGDVNPNGGGISLGHPLGATGARITATLLSELRAARSPVRDRDDVHRPGPGDRGRRRASLTRRGRSALLIDTEAIPTGADRVAARDNWLMFGSRRADIADRGRPARVLRGRRLARRRRRSPASLHGLRATRPRAAATLGSRVVTARDVRKIGVVGLGAMGAGIAQLAIEAGTRPSAAR